MLADVPRMAWFANIKMLLWRFVDKMDRECGKNVTERERPEGLARHSGPAADRMNFFDGEC
jgi:hypothetical protein